MLTFVDACGIDLETDRRWEQAWDRLAERYLLQGALAEAEQLRQQLAAALAAQVEADQARQRAENATQQEREKAQSEIERLQAELITRTAELEQARAEAAQAPEAARALADVAGALAQAGQTEQAITMARSITDPHQQARALAYVAGALAQARPDRAGHHRGPLHHRPGPAGGGAGGRGQGAGGEGVTEGTVTRWLKKEGEHVEADEPLLEVSTDKVDSELPSPVAGILRGITVAEDETVAVGGELGVLEADTLPAGVPVRLPIGWLAETITEGKVVRWLKREGEHVVADEPLLEVSTYKFDTGLSSPASGTLRGITTAEDQTVAVGAQLAIIEPDPG